MGALRTQMVLGIAPRDNKVSAWISPNQRICGAAGINRSSKTKRGPESGRGRAGTISRF